MEYWTLICNILSTISALGVLVCTIIGFKFIGKQTNIAKNKDILFTLQKETSSLLFCYYENHNQFYNTYHELILELNDNSIIPQNNVEKTLNDRKLIIANMEKLILERITKPLEESAINVGLYKWWLGKEYLDRIKKIKKSNEYECIKNNSKDYEKLTKCFESCVVLYSDVQNFASFGDELFKCQAKLKQIIDEFVKSYDFVTNEFNILFAELAEEKGVS